MWSGPERRVLGVGAAGVRTATASASPFPLRRRSTDALELRSLSLALLAEGERNKAFLVATAAAEVEELRARVASLTEALAQAVQRTTVD